MITMIIVTNVLFYYNNNNNKNDNNDNNDDNDTGDQELLIGLVNTKAEKVDLNIAPNTKFCKFMNYIIIY